MNNTQLIIDSTILFDKGEFYDVDSRKSWQQLGSLYDAS